MEISSTVARGEFIDNEPETQRPEEKGLGFV
jgi:hypothetical protein